MASKPLPTPTLSGKICELIGFLAILVGLKSGDRPLFVFGVVLFVPAVAGLYLTWTRIRGLAAFVHRPATARAFEDSRVAVTVTSRGRLRGLMVRDISRPHLGVALNIHQLAAGEPVTVEGTEVFTRRGRARTAPLAFSTARPFGLATCERRLGGGQALVVLPALGEVLGGLRRILDSGLRPIGRPVPRRGDGYDTRFLRPFIPGDSPRRIHWKTTARRGEIMVREYEDERAGVCVLALGGGHDGSGSQQRAWETAISLTATLLHLFSNRGRDVVLLLPTEDPVAYVRGGDRRAVLGAEERLAVLADDVGWPDASQIDQKLAVDARILVHPGTRRLPPGLSGVRCLDASALVAQGAFRTRSSAT